MARRRGRGSRLARVSRRIQKRVKRGFNLSRGASNGSVMGALQRPLSRMVAPAMGVASVAELILTPLPNGDSWLSRISTGYGYYKASGDPSTLLARDLAGNDATTILIAQLKQNALPAAGTAVLAGILGWIGRKVGV